MTESNQNCSRCRSPIRCQADNISECHCAKISISQDTVEYLRNTKYKCLCNNCLSEVDNLVHIAHNAPTKTTEGLHYIIENGLLVFTELNHIQRGYCCGSNCRNCAYGYQAS